MTDRKDRDASTRVAESPEKIDEDGPDSYLDPSTGYLVFTAKYLKNRGYCCDNGCRHCPY